MTSETVSTVRRVRPSLRCKMVRPHVRPKRVCVTKCWFPADLHENSCMNLSLPPRFDFGFFRSEYLTSTELVFTLELFPHQNVWITYHSPQLFCFAQIPFFFCLSSSPRQSPNNSVCDSSHDHICAGPLAGTLLELLGGVSCDWKTERWKWNSLARPADCVVLNIKQTLFCLCSRPLMITSTASCWDSGSGTGSCTTTGSAASLSARSTVPLSTGLISLVCFHFLSFTLSIIMYSVWSQNISECFVK